MTTEATAEFFRRDLADHVTVSVDGVYGDLVPDEPVKDVRTVGCVTIKMPDFIADTFAHNLAALWQLADQLGAERVSATERGIAGALFEAAQFMGYDCPDGGLTLPAGDNNDLLGRDAQTPAAESSHLRELFS